MKPILLIGFGLAGLIASSMSAGYLIRDHQDKGYTIGFKHGVNCGENAFIKLRVAQMGFVNDEELMRKAIIYNNWMCESGSDMPPFKDYQKIKESK